jgi:hypothetical protein
VLQVENRRGLLANRNTRRSFHGESRRPGSERDFISDALVFGRVREILGKDLTPQKIQVCGLSDDEIAALLRDDCSRFSAGDQALIPQENYRAR